MRVVIKEKIYDTATSSIIAVYFSPLDAADPAFFTEALYYKYPTNEYFLHKSSSRGHELEIVSLSRARKWYRTHFQGKKLPKQLHAKNIH